MLTNKNRKTMNNTANCGMISTLKSHKWHFHSAKANEELKYFGCLPSTSL